MATVTNAAGEAAQYSYDATGNLVMAKDYAGIVTTYTYSGDSLKKVTDENGETVFTYDTYNRLTAKTDAWGNTISYTYDTCGRISTMTAAGKRTTYEYDLSDRITRVIDHNGQATVYEYDALGNRSAVRYPNGTVMTYTYDACQRLKEECLTGAGGRILAKYSYTLGKNGERKKITETEEDGSVTEISYEYDKLSRLTKEVISCEGSSLTNVYTYDEVSNRISKVTTVTGDIAKIADAGTGSSNAASGYEVEITEGTTTYTYNILNQLTGETTAEGSISYEYDTNGNLVKQSGKKDVTYVYDKENHLIQAVIRKGNAVTTESYTYDYAGNRKAKEVNEGGKTCYVLDESSGLARVVAETDETGNVKSSYTLNGSERISMERDGKTGYYFHDGHGSVRGLTDENGTITDRYSYDAYGNLLKAEGNTGNDFLYTGEQYNANTGLYYLRARYMNPSTGTFISMDSYAGNTYDPVSLHKYLYANANPVMNTDPTGYLSLSDTTAYLAGSLTISGTQLKSTMVAAAIGAGILFKLRKVLPVVNATIRFHQAVAMILMEENIYQNTDEIVEKVKAEVAEETKDKNRDYVVYTLEDSEGVVRYVGRTKDYGRRMDEHDKPGGKKKEYGLKNGKIVIRNLTKEQARGLEQMLILYFHTQNFAKDLTVKYYNFINGISQQNNNKGTYYEAAKDYVNNNPTMFENFYEEELNALKEDMGLWW